MSKEKVIHFSVVIPLYNKEVSITRAIQSVLHQTYQNFQIIVVNDGSTDRSLENVQKLQDPRIKILTQENKGVSAARNWGVLESDSEWIAFLDADDEWLPEYLETMISLYSQFPSCGVLSSGFLKKDQDSFNFRDYLKIPHPENWRGLIDYYHDLRIAHPFCSSCITVQKSKLLEINGFPENLIHGEDLVTWVRLFQITDFAYIKKVGAIYHLDAENPSNLTRPEHEKDLYWRVIMTDAINELLQSGSKSIKYRQSLIELLASYSIPLVRSLIVKNDWLNAIKRLWLFRDTKIYRKKWIRLFLSNFFPIDAS